MLPRPPLCLQVSGDWWRPISSRSPLEPLEPRLEPALLKSMLQAGGRLAGALLIRSLGWRVDLILPGLKHGLEPGLLEPGLLEPGLLEPGLLELAH